MYIPLLLLFISLLVFAESKLYLTNMNVTEICEFEEDSCQVLFESDKIKNLLEEEAYNINIIGDDEFMSVKGACMLSSRFWNSQYGFIYPGTLWCGRGTKAENFTQLGTHAKEDSCCREHDNCPSSLTAGQCRGGVCNTSRFTRSHCECDNKFQKCLRETGSETANTIGAIFFNIASIFCFQPMPECPDRARTIVDVGSILLSCPFEFLKSNKYIFSEPFYTVKNRKAYYLNKILRKIGLGRK